MKLPLSKAFAHYFRLEGFRDRLEAILRGAPFASMGEVLGLSNPLMKFGKRLASAVATVVLLAASPVRGADINLRGIMIDRLLSSEPLPADLPTIVPTLVRLTIDDAWSSDAAATGALRRLEEVLRVYQKRNIRVVVSARTPAV